MNDLAEQLLEGEHDEFTIDPSTTTHGDLVNTIIGALMSSQDPMEGVRDMLGSLDEQELAEIYNHHFGRPMVRRKLGPPPAGYKPFPPHRRQPA